MNAGTFDSAAFDFLRDERTGGDVHPLAEQGRKSQALKRSSLDLAEDGPDDFDSRLEAVKASDRPLLEAASALLRMLAEMPEALDTTEAVESLRALLVREVMTFQRLCDKAELSWKHMAVVRYCLCTALDEAANASRWGAGGVWAAQSLLITFEGEVEGGEKFFLLIGRMATDPQEYVAILEILYRVLGLGFEGRYSVVNEGRRHLDQIRQRLWTIITTARDAVQHELSPHWRGEESGKLSLLRGVPAWVTAMLAALCLFGLFAFYQYHLLSVRNALQARILALGDKAPEIKAPVGRLRLSILLKDEIARGLVKVDEDEARSIVTFMGDSMFFSARSEVRPELRPVLDKVAREVNRVEGKVIITGHTDNQPIRTQEFPNNQALSYKRAEHVAGIMQSQGIPVGRMQIVGRGDQDPVADNATREGMAQNRRVEIMVTTQ